MTYALHQQSLKESEKQVARLQRLDHTSGDQERIIAQLQQQIRMLTASNQGLFHDKADLNYFTESEITIKTLQDKTNAVPRLEAELQRTRSENQQLQEQVRVADEAVAQVRAELENRIRLVEVTST